MCLIFDPYFASGPFSNWQHGETKFGDNLGLLPMQKMPFACASWLVYFTDLQSNGRTGQGNCRPPVLPFEPATLRRHYIFDAGDVSRAENVLLNGKLT